MTKAPPPPIRRRDPVLLVIAAFKFVKAALFIVIGLAAFGLLAPNVGAWAQARIATLAATYDSAMTARVIDFISRITSLTPHRLELLGAAAIVYAALFTVEGIGLWRGRHWAEYLTIIVTALLIPIEVYEVTRRVTMPRVGALVVNVIVVVYLIWRVRQKEAAG